MIDRPHWGRSPPSFRTGWSGRPEEILVLQIMVDLGDTEGYNRIMENITLELTEEEAIEVLYTLRDKSVEQRGLADRLINDTNSRMAGFNQHDEAALMEGVVDRLFQHMTWLAEEDPEEWE